ncbi:MAG: FHA domain-containing protein [Anaerolineales bacterium]|nr:FHA domain-containing protein [Anaerolineales bacterium]
MSVSVLMLAARIALAACLYAFLALVLVTLWRDLRAAAGVQPAGSAHFSLRRLREDGTTDRDYPLQKESCFIGRSPSLEVSLADETVSVVHARLWKEAGRWWLEDLDSRNGTLLNQIPVSKKTVLCAGDRIRTGRILLEFRIEDSSQPPAKIQPRATDTPA